MSFFSVKYTTPTVTPGGVVRDQALVTVELAGEGGQGGEQASRSVGTAIDSAIHAAFFPRASTPR